VANAFDAFDNPVVSGARDVGTAFAIGSNSLLKMAGDLATLTTGKKTGLSQLAQENIEYLQRQKSPELVAAEQEREAAVNAEENPFYQAWSYIKKTASDPRLLATTVAETAPSAIGPGALGAGARVATGKLLAKKGAEFATKAGVGTAIGAGTAMQAADVGGDQFDELLRTMESMDDDTAMQIPQVADLVQNKGATIPEAKGAVALELARKTALGAGAVSAVSQMVPGGRTIERALVGKAEKAAAPSIARAALAGLKGAAGEATQESIEEGGGQTLKNILARAVEPEREAMAGVGPAVGQAVIGAGALGGMAGVTQGRPSRPEATPRPVPASQVEAGISDETPAPAATKPSLAAEQQATLERSEEMTSDQFWATVNIRQARLMGGEPNPEDVRLVGDVPAPRVIIDPDVMYSAVEETQQALNDWRAKNPNAPENMVIVFDPEMLHNGFGIQGAFNQRDGSIFINAAFVSPENVGKIASHEWAHATLASPEGQRAFAEFAAREIPQKDLDALATRYGTQDRMVLLEEWIAENQEKAPGVISRIVARIREWLSQFGIVDLNDQEVADIMLRNLREQSEGKIQPDTQRVEGGIAPDQNLEVYETFIGNRLDAGPKFALQKLPTAADVTDAKGNLRYTIPKKTIDVSHYSFVPDLTEVDPAYYGTGRGEHYHRMMKGINKSFFFVGNSKPKAHENVAGKGMNRYRTTIDSSRIYDMDKDPLELWFAPNPQKSEGALKELGYDGFYAKTDDGRAFVALFYPTSIEEGTVRREAGVTEPEVALPEETQEEYFKRLEREDREAIKRAMAESRKQAKLFAKGSKYSLTPELRNFTRGSVAVDENGRPQVYYHGTPAGFEGNIFKSAEAKNRRGNVAGYYFTPEAEEASWYSGDREGGYAEGAQILPVYLAIKDPFIPGKSFISEEMKKAYREELEKSNPWISDNRWFDGKIADLVERRRISSDALNADGDAYQRVIKAGGYDGFQDGRHLVAFEPTQIKSAIGNVGSFGQRPVTEEEAARVGMTEEEANRARRQGDIRFSLASEKAPSSELPSQPENLISSPNDETARSISDFYQNFQHPDAPEASRAGEAGARGEAADTGQERPEIQSRGTALDSTELTGDGRGFTGFFAAVSAGTKGAQNTGKEYVPVIPISDEAKSFADIRRKYRGNFDNHIATSIPGFEEVQTLVGKAISDTYADGGSMLDIGASEGALIKAVTESSDGNITTVGIDPNVQMSKHFEKQPVEGSEYLVEAFGSKEQEGQLAWDEEDGTKIRYYNPKGQTFDVVHEAMVFQFISNTRNAQIERMKQLLKPDGIVIMEEKVANRGDVYRLNEAKKDRYKSQYYTAEEMEKKRREVLEKGGDKVEGMTNLQVAAWELEQALAKNFKNVAQFWDSGNFKGYVASDDVTALNNFLSNLESTETEYSTVKTPRTVSGQEGETKYSLAQTKTPEFKRWFRNSEVTANGRPMVMYHGTIAEDFTEFKPGGGLIFVSPSREMADLFTDTYTRVSDPSRKQAPEGSRIYPVFVRAENPFDYQKKEHLDALFGDKSELPSEYKEGDRISRYSVAMGDWEEIEALTQQIKDLGFDGLYVKERGVKNLAVFDPRQLKSATGNVGTFDPENPDIRYSLTAEPRELGTSKVDRELLGIPDTGKKVPIEVVAKALNDFTKERLGGAEFTDEDVAIAHGVMNAVAEGRNQLLQREGSGADWYDTDIVKTKRMLQLAFPTLKNNTDLVLFTAMMTPLSFGNNPVQNVRAAGRVYEAALAKGEDVWGNLPARQESGKGWSNRAKAVELAINRLNDLINDRGERGAANWLLTKHPVSELRKYNKNVSGKMDDMKYGAYIFGPKGGPFFLNINGIKEEMTKDLWWSRTFNRWFGTMQKTAMEEMTPEERKAAIEEGIIDEDTGNADEGFQIQETPRNLAERARMDKIAKGAADELGLTIEELQATLWYYEQQLWKRLGARVESYSFSDGAKTILEDKGIEVPRFRRSSSEAEKRRQVAYDTAGAVLRGEASPVKRKSSVLATP